MSIDASGSFLSALLSASLSRYHEQTRKRLTLQESCQCRPWEAHIQQARGSAAQAPPLFCVQHLRPTVRSCLLNMSSGSLRPPSPHHTALPPSGLTDDMDRRIADDHDHLEKETSPFGGSSGYSFSLMSGIFPGSP